MAPDGQSVAALRAAHPEAAAARVAAFDLAGRRFDGNECPAIMGVVNLSPESRHRDSVCATTEEAIARGCRLFGQGAAIVDVGAESSLTEAARVDEAGQIARLVPVVRGLAPQGIVSVETYLPGVAWACLEAGARVLNLTGRAQVEEMYRAVAAHDAAVVICFSDGENVRENAGLDPAADPIPWLDAYFARQVEAATASGVTRLWLDPGVSFQYRGLDPAARRAHAERVFLNAFRLRARGWPVCQALPYAFRSADGRMLPGAESYYALLARLGGADLLRAHDVETVREAVL